VESVSRLSTCQCTYATTPTRYAYFIAIAHTEDNIFHLTLSHTTGGRRQHPNTWTLWSSFLDGKFWCGRKSCHRRS